MTVIDLKNVSKRFLIHRQRQLAADRARRSKATLEDFWALRDVSFQVKAGENVALVGGNGAGKSTLLGIIAGVITATSGEVHKVGRLGALLELGTGFHPDLTGRENIHLNASLLGFRRQDVEREFDAIVDFAELPEFIDEPVRTYSSGMIARLGFSVAVHIDPDILIMDEVLSVGDKGFQQKCQKRIYKLAAQGKTLLFVSHQLAAVEAMCPRTVWLEKGRVRLDGPTEEVLPKYEAAMTKLPHRRDSIEVVRARSAATDEAD